MTASIEDALAQYLDLPFAFLGDCSGALIAFEVVRLLQRNRKPLPCSLFVASSPPPDAPTPGERASSLPYPEFIKRIAEFGGVPREVLASAEMMELLEPALRADYKMIEDYECDKGASVDVPITAFWGNQDAALNEDDLQGWRRSTTGGFDIHALDGGHFLVAERPAEMLAHVAHQILPAAGLGTGAPP